MNDEFNILLSVIKIQMKFFVITIIVLSIFIIPTAFAESAPDIFVQVIHRDSDGNLIAYLQSDKMSTVNVNPLTFLLDHESSLNEDPIYEIDDKKLQVITRQATQTFDYQTLRASTQLFVDINNVEVLAVKFIHDGFRVTSGDTITTVWSFARFV